MSTDYDADLDSFDLIRRVKKMMISSWPELDDEPTDRRGRLVRKEAVGLSGPSGPLTLVDQYYLKLTIYNECLRIASHDHERMLYQQQLRDHVRLVLDILPDEFQGDTHDDNHVILRQKDLPNFIAKYEAGLKAFADSILCGDVKKMGL